MLPQCLPGGRSQIVIVHRLIATEHLRRTTHTAINSKAMLSQPEQAMVPTRRKIMLEATEAMLIKNPHARILVQATALVRTIEAMLSQETKVTESAKNKDLHTDIGRIFRTLSLKT